MGPGGQQEQNRTTVETVRAHIPFQPKPQSVSLVCGEVYTN